MKIKYAFLLVSFFVAIATQVLSQDRFPEGSTEINIGVGFGNLYYGGLFGTGFSSTPAITLSLDHGFRKIDEIQGTIGLGGLIGFQGATANYPGYKYHWNNFIIAFRATYHAGFLNTEKFDLYGGLMIGVRIETVNPDFAGYGRGYLSGGAFVGGAYYFRSNVGVFAELGYDVSYLKVGLALNVGGH